MTVEYRIVSEPAGASYRALLNWLGGIADRFGIVFPDCRRQVAARFEIGASLAPWLAHEERGNRWPGTREHGGKRRLAYYSVSTASVAALVEFGPASLFAWTGAGSGSGQDLFFLRADGSAILSRVADAELAWLSLRPAEEARLWELSSLSLALERTGA